MDQPTLRISEIYRSIQGETSWAGLPFVFVRLGGCHLRCVYCDSEYALTGGDPMPIDEVLNIVETYACDCVLITGGEPLLQPEVHPLISQLCDRGKTVLIETSGACDISPCDPRSIIILDLKTPGSGMEEHNCWENIPKLRPQDEIKFVIMDRADYEWAREVIRQHDLTSSFASRHEGKCVGGVLMSPVHEVTGERHIPGCEGLDPQELASWILEDDLPVRLQLQIHKFVWGSTTRGV